MLKHAEMTRKRLQGFMSDANLHGRLYAQRAPVKLSVFAAPGRIGYVEAMRGHYRPARIGEQFGPVWATHWFRVRISIPRAWKGREAHLLWDSCSEACIWRDGEPVQGLVGTRGLPWAGTAIEPIRAEFVLTRRAQGGEQLTLYVEAASNHLFGVEAPRDLGLLKQAEIALFNGDAWALLWDFTTVAEAALKLPADTPRGAQALHAANRMINLCDLDDRSTWPRARAVAREFLSARNGGGQHNISAIGHAHIDTAWLWPLAETKRKCYRTFASALLYMERYPEYKFACSQAQQYEWMKNEQPALYARIKRAVKSGRFIPVGGTWVEPDCNIPSGESLVRQFLIGQRFFRKEFGTTCSEFWSPDAFGYNGQLPQIIRGAGIRHFLTQKLSWNQFNKPASHTFWWEGIDGSRVLAHFPPVDGYNSDCSVEQLVFSVRNYKDLDRSNESCYLFGYGDGGGGPSVGMLERLRRVRDVDGLPRVQIRSPREFFARLEAGARDITTQVGELYLEMHRGAYTTQALTKLLNRRAEDALHDAEFLSVVAGGAYPSAELERLWKLVLLNQFHDIIPGSSIAGVYRDSEKQYREALDTAEALSGKAVASLPLPPGRRVAAINTLDAPRVEVVDLPGSRRPGVVRAPAMGYAVQEPAARVADSAMICETGGRIVLENMQLRAEFLKDGALVSLLHKGADREAVAGRANQFVIFDDEPVEFDAWDVEVYHLEKRRNVAGAFRCRIVERHPLRVSVEFHYHVTPHSTLKQVVGLSALSPRLDFECAVDWRERHKFLKVEFPLAVRSEQATYEIQFGHLRRPTHFNTSHDMARFEVCAHRWADLSEPGFGVSLLNDCKYGHAVHGNVMRLSLLRAPKSPDPGADMGQGRFRYALLPHAGSFADADVVREARRFNVPLILRKTSAPAGERSFFSVDRKALVIDTVKKAEDSGAIIVRLYEAHGSRGSARLVSSLPVRSARRCNLLEEEGPSLKWNRGGVTLEFRPFEIITLKLTRK